MSSNYILKGTKTSRARQPEEILGDLYTKNIIIAFKALAQTYARYLDKSMQTIFYRRFGLDGNKSTSMSDLGIEFNVSRERIRQKVFLITHQILRLINGKDLKKPRIFYRPGNLFKNFEESLKSTACMTSSKMLGILRNHSDTDIEDLGGYLDLLMYLYGYEICMHGHIKYYYKNISVLNINKRITELKLYLSKQALYTSENDIKKELKLTSEEFDFYIGFLSGLEIKEDKETYYRVSIKDLFSVQCCVYRILYENECPMHFQELEHALIVKNRDMTESTLHGSLSKSNPLFAPIGHTGYWVLKEWGMNTDSIRKLVETALTTVNKPLGIDELFKTLNKIRVIDVNSIRSTLCAYNEVFVQYADSTFGLVIWELNKTLKLKKPKTYVKEHLRDILLEKILVLLKNKKPTSLSKLIESLKKSGYSKPTIYAAITAREDLFNKTELKGPKGRLISLR